MNRADRQYRKLARYEAWLRAQLEHEKELPSASTAAGKRVIRALARDHRDVVSQLELASDAAEEVTRRGKRAQGFGFVL